jgi:hypothetical protein
MVSEGGSAAIAVEYYAARDASEGVQPWFSHLWVARHGGEAVGFLHASWEGKIMMVGVDPDHRRRGGVADALVQAAAVVFPGRLTYGYPVSAAGRRFVERHRIPVHPVDERRGEEEWPEEAAEAESADRLKSIRGRGSEPFAHQLSTPRAVLREDDD